MPQSPAAILARMRSSSPSSPRLVWHGRDGRIELSGRVFDNWVAKSSNFLVDELDAEEATEVAFDLPVHWKTLALAFACWQVGAVAVVADADNPGSGADPSTGAPADGGIVLSSAATDEPAGPGVLVCVALGSLAFAWDGPLPRGAVDFAAEVRSHGDVFPDPVDDGEAPGRVLVRVGHRDLTAEDLRREVTLPAPQEGATNDGTGTLLVDPGAGLVRVLAAAYALWHVDGSLVLVEDGVPVTEGLLTGERVTGRL